MHLDMVTLSVVGEFETSPIIRGVAGARPSVFVNERALARCALLNGVLARLFAHPLPTEGGALQSHGADRDHGR